MHAALKVHPAEPGHPAYRRNHPTFRVVAERDLARGTVLGLYGGEVVPRDRDQSSDYRFDLDDHAIDACRVGNRLRLVNDFRNVAARPNAAADEFEFELKNGSGYTTVRYVTLCAIKRGDEVLVDYGENYWYERRRYRRVYCESCDVWVSRRYLTAHKKTKKHGRFAPTRSFVCFRCKYETDSLAEMKQHKLGRSHKGVTLYYLSKT